MATTKLPARLAKKDLAPTAAIRGAYDIKLTAEAAAKLQEIEEAAAFAVEQASLAAAVSIVDDASNAAGTELIVNLTKVRKMLEDLQKFFTSPLEANKKKVIATIKALGAAALTQETRLRGESEALWMKKENERQEAERERLAKQREAELRARQLGKAAPKPLPPAAAPEPERTVQAENGSTNMKLVWDFAVDDEAKVPAVYRSLDEKKVNAAIAAGVREIPGLRIFQRPQLAVK